MAKDEIDYLVDWQLEAIRPGLHQVGCPILTLKTESPYIHFAGARWSPKTGWTNP